MASARKKRRPLPAWYLKRPAQVSGCEFIYEAYRDLVTCRLPDASIPWTAAMQYADRKGWPPDVADAVWVVVNKMDLTEREWRFEELQREYGNNDGIPDRSADRPGRGDAGQ